jgi:hypothetical protein
MLRSGRSRPRDDSMSTEANKQVVARAVDEVINSGNLDAVDQLYDPAIAADAKA